MFNAAWSCVPCRKRMLWCIWHSMVLSLAGCPFHLMTKQGLRYVKPHVVQSQHVILAECSSCVQFQRIQHLHWVSKSIFFWLSNLHAAQHCSQTLPCHNKPAPIGLQQGYNTWMQLNAHLCISNDSSFSLLYTCTLTKSDYKKSSFVFLFSLAGVIRFCDAYAARNDGKYGILIQDCSFSLALLPMGCRGQQNSKQVVTCCESREW